MNAEINSYEERMIGNKNVVFYKVQIGFTKNNRKWILTKRYSEFDDLNKHIKDMYPNLPSLPAKTWVKMTDPRYIEERQKILNTYIKVSFSIHILLISISLGTDKS
jgi:hypothetical protein